MCMPLLCRLPLFAANPQHRPGILSIFLACASAGCFVLLSVTSFAAEPVKPEFSAEQLEFFEREVKPILKANCVVCHGGEKKVQSKFDLTSREGVLKGGEIGVAVSLDKLDESPLLEAINYESLEMPPKGKLPQAQIDVLTKWV